MTVYVGIDNGCSGSIGIIGLDGGPLYLSPPTKVEQNYTKKKDNVTRIDVPALEKLLFETIHAHVAIPERTNIKVFLERPFVNPGAFKATGRALRSLEATLIVLESLGLSYQYCDSRGWQGKLLPSGLKGAKELKKASKDIGLRMFPMLEKEIKKQGDADGILIAEWARREGL